jgi:hypothetical protein
MLFDRKLAVGAVAGVAIAIGTMVGASALRSGADDAGPEGARTLLTGQDAVAAGCQPHEAAIIQQFTLRGERGLNSQCVIVTGRADAPLAPEPTSPVPGGYMPAGYTPQPAVFQPQPTPAPSVAPRAPRPVRGAESGRTWKKTALVIGGSTAAGAGIGGLVGGKKGALIGSAIGGGASTIYEAMKRK